MDQFIELLKQVNISQIFVIFAGFWIFYNRLDKKIDKNKDEIKQDLQKMNDKIDKVEINLNNKVDKLELKIDRVEINLNHRIDKVEINLSDKIDKLSEKVEDVDRRLCRIEGSLQTHGHCLFSQSNSEKKAQ